MILLKLFLSRSIWLLVLFTMATIEEIRLLIPGLLFIMVTIEEIISLLLTNAGLATKADVAIMMADFANMKADMLTKVD